MKILVPIGTRPEIVKLAPLVHVLRRQGFDVRVVATGQHTDHALAGVFFERFALTPDECWEPRGQEPNGCASSMRTDRLLPLGRE